MNKFSKKYITNKIPLKVRIEWFLNNNKRFKENKEENKKLPIHPSDLVEALVLRKLGKIPNMDIKVLGGDLFPQLSTIYMEGK